MKTVAFARFSKVGFIEPQQALVLPFLLNVTNTPARFRNIGGTANESANSLKERLVNARPKCLLSVDFAINASDEWLEFGVSSSMVVAASSEVGLEAELEVELGLEAELEVGLETGLSATFAKLRCIADKNEINRKTATDMVRVNFSFLSV